MDVVMGKQLLSDFLIVIDLDKFLSVVEILVGIMQISFSSQERGTSTY
jgi:hypothetical protein